jgi:hypothetical protein
MQRICGMHVVIIQRAPRSGICMRCPSWASLPLPAMQLATPPPVICFLIDLPCIPCNARTPLRSPVYVSSWLPLPLQFACQFQVATHAPLFCIHLIKWRKTPEKNVHPARTDNTLTTRTIEFIVLIYMHSQQEIFPPQPDNCPYRLNLYALCSRLTSSTHFSCQPPLTHYSRFLPHTRMVFLQVLVVQRFGQPTSFQGLYKLSIP